MGVTRFMIVEQQGVFGYILLLKLEPETKADYPWQFTTSLILGNLFLQEAHLGDKVKHNQ